VTLLSSVLSQPPSALVAGAAGAEITSLFIARCVRLAEMNLIGQLLPLLVVALILWLIVGRKVGGRLPHFTMPAPRPRPKRSHLRMVKTSTMDTELAELLKNGNQPRRD
jgi:hypothetical protein